MTLREILTNAGIEENTIKTIETAMKANQVYITSEENADIRLRKNKAKIEKLESDLDDAVTKIEGFKDLENEKETLSKEVENLKKAATEKDFNIALESALKEAKVKNSKLVKALLDNEKLTLKDGKLEGIEDQLKTIKEENDFLFEKIPGGVPDFSTGGKTNTESKEDSVGKRLGKQRAEQIKDSGINKFIK
jgi:hypothetical protein